MRFIVRSVPFLSCHSRKIASSSLSLLQGHLPKANVAKDPPSSFCKGLNSLSDLEAGRSVYGEMGKKG